MGWVTIKGRHVLIEDNQARLTGGGHDGTHDPATSTGNGQVDAILKSRLQPAVILPSGEIRIGERGQYHWEITKPEPGKTFFEDYVKKGFRRGFVDMTTRKYYDAEALGLEASDIGTRPNWLRNP